MTLSCGSRFFSRVFLRLFFLATTGGVSVATAASVAVSTSLDGVVTYMTGSGSPELCIPDCNSISPGPTPITVLVSGAVGEARAGIAQVGVRVAAAAGPVLPEGGGGSDSHHSHASADFVDAIHLAFSSPLSSPKLFDLEFRVGGKLDFGSNIGGSVSGVSLAFLNLDADDLAGNTLFHSHTIVEDANGTILGNSLLFAGTFPIDISIPAGLSTFDFSYSMFLVGDAHAQAIDDGGVVSAEADFIHTAKYAGGGMQELNGTPFTDFSLTSDSGYNYPAAVSADVPEPSAFFLVGAAVVLFILRRNPTRTRAPRPAACTLPLARA